ncbi:MAG: TetR family transcriptional regulator C-terminal domain-containing protein, partial [Candidatus Nanopelagicales bacterium]
VFQAVVDGLTQQLDQDWRVGPEHSDPVDRIAEANRRYLDSFTANARLLQVIEQASTADPQYRRLLSNFRQRYVERAVAGIRRLQADGVADPTLDPYLAGSALCAMVEGFGRQWIARSEEHDRQVVADTLTRLWAQALGLNDQQVPRSGRSTRRSKVKE